MPHSHRAYYSVHLCEAVFTFCQMFCAGSPIDVNLEAAAAQTQLLLSI